jgi:phospholipid-binding lipoprotein MlaA
VLGIVKSARFARILTMPLVFVGSQAGYASESDPWESWNTRVHAFNEHLDAAILRPVATTYVRIVPPLARRGVSNVFYNLLDVTVLLNNVLQLKMVDAASDSGRILLNTTVGIGGLIDVATEAGLERNDEDFGQTLGRWGVGAGPYMVLPLFGPSNVRDTVGLFVDTFTNPMTYHHDPAVRNGTFVLEQVDKRVAVLVVDSLMMGDQYLFTREAYIQQREYLVLDGEVQDNWDDDEWDRWD